MKYSTETNRISIELYEFITLARRSLSPLGAPDEEEPKLKEVTGRRLDKIIGDHRENRLYFEFSSSGYLFEMSPLASDITENRITVAREVASPLGKPKKDETEKTRGEGFVLGHILASVMGYEDVELRFVYLAENSPEYTVKEESVSASKLSEFFEKCLNVLKIYAVPEIERVTERLPTLKTLKFPYKNIREGQSIFVRSAYRTLSRGGKLFASAPTGTGKTVSALYPALRTLGDGRCDKVFYLTPKTTTAEAARDCLDLFSEAGAKVKGIILSAKEKCCIGNHVCKMSRNLCKNAACKHLTEAILALYKKNITVVTSADILPLAKEYSVCPYELELSYSELCDVIICDFNYLFDPTVYIRRYFTKGGRYAALVDEAHNLPERAREMFSAELSFEELSAPADTELLGEHSKIKKLAKEVGALFFETLYMAVKDELHTAKDGVTSGAHSLSEIPPKLYPEFDKLLSACDEEIRSERAAKDSEKDLRVKFLYDYYYKIKKFYETALRFDDGYSLMIFYKDGKIRARLFCLDTAKPIKKRLSLCHGALLFSATLSPLGYYREILGGERSDETIEVNSPFTPEQLSVSIMDKISTRYSERERTLPAVVRAVAAMVSAKRGNYMVFSPSFEYNQALSEAFRQKYPKLKILTQTQNMSYEEKSAFLDEFKRESSSYLVGFCVMGGLYAEGVDLYGDSLIGAAIVGIGMPSLSYEREAMADYYQQKYEEGKQYAYIYPGMNRVFQAAGRVIRREDDRGVILLIDDRFDDPIYKESLPKLWQGVKFIDDPKRLKEVIDEFWSEA